MQNWDTLMVKMFLDIANMELVPLGRVGFYLRLVRVNRKFRNTVHNHSPVSMKPAQCKDWRIRSLFGVKDDQMHLIVKHCIKNDYTTIFDSIVKYYCKLDTAFLIKVFFDDELCITNWRGIYFYISSNRVRNLVQTNLYQLTLSELCKPWMDQFK
jgi:hypothetical protein